MNNSRQSWRAKIQAYIVERRDEANNEFDEFCARWRIRPPKRVQEQQRRTACRRVKADEDLVGIDAENQTNEQFVERGEETYSRPMNSNITRDQASGVHYYYAHDFLKKVYLLL
jgi:hypothetical protein